MYYLSITIALIVFAVVSYLVMNQNSQWIIRHHTSVTSINMSVLLTFTVMELVPRVVEFSHESLIFMVLGVILPLLLIRTRHTYDTDGKTSQSVILIMGGACLHSLADGVLIAIGFMMEEFSGIILITTMIIHKSTEMLMFAMILVNRVRSLQLLFCLLSLSLVTALGMTIPLLWNGSWGGLQHLVGFALSFSAGFFIFIALTALLGVVKSAKVKNVQFYPLIGCALYIGVHWFLH